MVFNNRSLESFLVIQSINHINIKNFKMDSAINIARPWPLMSLVGFISKLYSRMTTIHLPLLPSRSCVRMSLKTEFGEKAMMCECRMYTLKSFKALTKAKACFSIMLYFKGASLNALLKNAIGYSCPCGFFCRRTSAMVCSDANEKI